MGNMKDIGLLDCEDRPSVEENFKRVRGAILDSNGKLKSEVLPEGYPHEEIAFLEPLAYNYTPVEKTAGNPCHADSYSTSSQTLKLGASNGLQEGQIVRVNYDGVDYDCVVRYNNYNWWIGNPTLSKDTSENGNFDYAFIDYIETSEHYVDSGEPFFYIVHNYYSTRYALFTLDTKPRTVTFAPKGIRITPMDKKFLPYKVLEVNVYYDITNSKWVCDKTKGEILAAENAGIPVIGTLTDNSGNVFTLIGSEINNPVVLLVAFSVLNSIYPMIYKVYLRSDRNIEVEILTLTATSEKIV